MEHETNGHGVALADPERVLEGQETDEQGPAPTDAPQAAPKRRAARAAKPAPAPTEPTEERPTAVALREAKATADAARRKVTAAHALRVANKRAWLDSESAYRQAVTDRKRATDAELRAWEADAAAEVADVR